MPTVGFSYNKSKDPLVVEAIRTNRENFSAFVRHAIVARMTGDSEQVSVSELAEVKESIAANTQTLALILDALRNGIIAVKPDDTEVQPPDDWAAFEVLKGQI